MRRNEQALASPREISSRSASVSAHRARVRARGGDAAVRGDDTVDRFTETPQGTADVTD